MRAISGRCSVFTQNMRDHKHMNGMNGTVVGVNHPFRTGHPEDQSQPIFVVKLDCGKTIRIPEGCVCEPSR